MNNSASSSSRLWERLLNKPTFVWKNVQGTYLLNQCQPIEEIRQNIFCDISSIGWDWLSREVPRTLFLCGHLAININCTLITLTEGTKSLPFSPPIYFNIVTFKVEFSLGSLHKLIWSKVISSLNPLLLAQLWENWGPKFLPIHQTCPACFLNPYFQHAVSSCNK